MEDNIPHLSKDTTKQISFDISMIDVILVLINQLIKLYTTYIAFQQIKIYVNIHLINSKSIVSNGEQCLF